VVVVTREGLNLAPTVAKALQISPREEKLIFFGEMWEFFNGI
jgi:hypothetical protein